MPLQNLLTYSQDLSGTGWTPSAGATMTANYTTAPDGTSTANRVQFTAGARYIFNFAGGSGIAMHLGTYTISLWARGTSGAATFALRLQPSLAAVNSTSPDITLDTTWRRYSWSATVTTVGGGFMNAAFLMSDSGSNASDFLLWGIQIVQANWEGEYQPTTSTAISSTIPLRNKVLPTLQNLLIYSEQFDNAAYTVKIGLTVTPNAIANPVNGSATADAIVEDGSTGIHVIGQPGPLNPGKRYTSSVFVKAGTRNFAQIQTNGNIAYLANVDLTTGVISLDGTSGPAIFTSTPLDRKS